MKKTIKLLALVMAVMMLVSALPIAVSADTYDVLLNCGPQGWGSTAWPLQRNSGEKLPLYHTRDTIFANYGMLPGYYTTSDQRVFIEWNTAYDARTGRGTGDAYYDYYDGDESQYLYAIWGYNIQLNADGGVFPATGNGVYLSYVANFNNSNYNDPLTDYEYCFPDYVGGAPVKEGCRRVMYNGSYAYGLLRNDLSFFTWEGPGQNLTIPPTGGAMPWSAFHCVNTYRGLSLEFVAIWEPSITYDANGGSGYMDVDYLTFDYGSLWNYEYYTVKNSAYTKSGTYFTGWNTKPDGSGVKVAPGTVFGGQMTNSDPITLYAQWADGSSGHKHSYSGTVTKQPTCTATGVKTYKCACGAAYTETIAALGHNTVTTTTAATCTTAGKTVTSCTRCGASSTSNIPALGHDLVTSTTSATCTEGGKSVTTCKRCGASMTQDTPALGHDLVTTTTSATCTEGGKSVTTCKRCGVSMTQDTPALGHDYKTTTTSATCTKEGVTVTACTRCGDSTTTTTPALGHSYNNGTITTKPTCSAEGVKTFTCTVCKDSYTQVMDKLNHTFGNYTYNKDATCGADGTKTRICISCQTTETVVAEGTATGEHLFYDYIYNNDATCTKDGTMTAVCEYGCGAEDTIKDMGTALGHNYASVTTDATCTEAGSIVYTCETCGDSYSEVIPAKGHSWSAWTQTKAPSTTETGVEERSCASCGAEESRDVPMLDADAPIVADVTNYTVKLNGIKNIKEIRYALGHYATGAEVRAAEKNQTLSASLVNSLTVDGVMTYEVPWVGEYTFWVRLNDGSQYFLYCDVNDIDPYLVSDGLKLTVMDFGEGYKDMWIAEGTWNTYSEIKNNATTKFQAAEAKLANYFANHDFTYTTANPGEHTVLIRYNDGTQDVLHINLTVDVPTFDVNGLQVTVGNIPGVKIIRTAYGEYNSVAEIKNVSGVRNFNNKTAIKDADSYKIQYRDNGVVTVIVEYATGYKHIEHINIQQKASSAAVSGNTVTISNIENGFVMLRYAEGTYKTSAGVKEANGSKYVKEATNGKIVVENLTAGKYTFCVQYDDESFNFHYIEIK